MLRRMRWLLISKILARWRPSSHIDLPLFLRFFTQYRLVIFFVALAESLLLALIFLSGDGVPGAASRLAYAACQRVSRTCCFLLLAALFFFFASFVVDLDSLVAGGLRHEFA